MTARLPFFYGWVIVAIGAIGGTLVYGIRNSFSVFFPSILNEFGWQRGSTALMLSLNILVYGLMAPVAGSLGDRWKPRRDMTIGIIVLGLATIACAFARELWQFYLLFGIIAPAGSACCGAPLFAPAVPNWFARRRGLVMGLGQIGGGLSFAYGIFVEFVISQVGWRNAYFVLAGILLVVLVPLYLLFFYYRPEEKGLKPYGISEPATDNSKAVGTGSLRDWTLLDAMKTYQLWLMVLSYFLYWGIGNYLVLAHQVKFAEDAGYSGMLAATIFGLFGIFMITGQLCSFLSDRLGREKTATLATALSIGALVALISVRDSTQPWLLYVYAVGFGLGAGLYLPALVAGLADVFHGRHFGAIQGFSITGLGLGGAIGPWLGGYIYDISGSYISAFIFSTVCLALGCAVLWIAAPRHAARLQHKSH